MPARIDDLTCCRAIFACWVFIYHLNLQLLGANLFGTLEPAVQRGYLGVDAFFILSGLVLAHAHPNLGHSWPEMRTFWLRRWLRLYPVHLAVIMLLLAMFGLAMLAGMAPRDPQRFSLDALLRNLALVHAWAAPEHWAWNYPSWSISTEWTGYLAFPLLWMGFRRLSARQATWVLPALVAALAAAEWVAGGMHLNLAYRAGFARFLPEFLAGMALARCAPLLRTWRAAPSLVWLGGGGAILASLLPRATPVSDTLVVLALGMLIAGLFARGMQGRGPVLARLPGFVFLGTISYSFYMSFAVVEMSQAVLWRRLTILPAAHVWLFSLSTMAATLTLAWALWRFVEKPGKDLYTRVEH